MICQQAVMIVHEHKILFRARHLNEEFNWLKYFRYFSEISMNPKCQINQKYRELYVWDFGHCRQWFWFNTCWVLPVFRPKKIRTTEHTNKELFIFHSFAHWIEFIAPHTIETIFETSRKIPIQTSFEDDFFSHVFLFLFRAL